jgi:ribosomal protein S27AE
MSEDGTYTLEQARIELARRECAAAGHDFNIISTGAGDPVKIVCGRCGKRWGIAS